MTPEGKIKVWLVNQITRKYGKVWSYAPPSGMFGQAGTADRFFLIQGVFVAIEVKKDGADVTPLQRARLRIIQENGGVAASMSGKDLTKLQKIYDEIDRRIALLKGLL